MTEKKDVSSATSLGFKTKFSDKSFIYIMKSSSPRIEPWGTPASTLTHVEFDHLELLFAFYLLESFPKYLVSYPLPHFVLTYK